MFALRCRAVAIVALAVTIAAVRADGPADNIPNNVRPVPPKGIDLPAADAEQIKAGLAELQGLIKDIGQNKLLPDVQVYEKAVRYAVTYKEVFNAKGIPAVKKVLKEGLDRARALKDGKHPWTTQKGGVLRGYRSKIDGSPQPYWIIVPNDYEFDPATATKRRLDFWWHGRGETLSEVNFMANSPGAGGGIIPAPGALILHPYGRYCNANKLAGEIDTLECLDHAKNNYQIDPSRLVARGFSMGGAACWQYAVHYPTLWCAAAPGAGFSETPEFLNVYQNEKIEPTWYEKKLWHMYNATDYALNIFDLPTVAYSGEIDRQKQAADVMAREMKKVGLELTHIIGPKTAHAYEKGARIEVNRRIDAIVAKGKPREPRPELRFTTYTLQYNQCGWIRIEGLGKHWEEATVFAQSTGGSHTITTKNVTAISLTHTPSGTRVRIDEDTISAGSDPSRFRKVGGKWVPWDGKHDGLAKKPGLQGPIDDAFMDSFVMVKPTGKPITEAGGKWVAGEMKHAVAHWRQQFRGDAPIKNDTAITDADIANSNLILWGDPQSNKVLARIADRLPIKWDSKIIVMGDKTLDLRYFDLGGQAYPCDTHAPVLIFPNPLNPKKYVVLNSGFTFREYDYLNNARQVPKLPDYAVIDITTPPNSRYPGKIVRAGFFGEKWELLPNDGK